jgi:glycine cleavage system H protein
MVFIFVILFATVVIGIEIFRRSRARVAAVPRARMVVSPSTPSVIERYFHPGHCWALVKTPQLATVGIDDFAQHLIGAVDAVEFPPEGYTVYQGQPVITLRHGTKTLTQVAPISGVVERINRRLATHPTLVNRSPYDRGWVLRMVPTNLRNDIHNLLRGGVAERWQEAVRIQLIKWFSPKLGTVLQDGGEFVANISDLLTDREWEQLLHEFFPYVTGRKYTMSKL